VGRTEEKVFNMWLWLDDERPVPDSRWTPVRTAEECIKLLKQGGVEKLSLDHDLGVGYSTGYKVACFVEEAAHNGTIEPIMRMYAHSANPVGRRKMGQALHNAYKIWQKRKREGDA
jgi:hypothetical protein